MTGVRPPAVVLLNAEARGGRGAELWERVRREVESRFSVALVQLSRGRSWERPVADELRRGTRVFVAAGGDGTVHALAAALVRLRDGIPLGELCLGAVGTGSSNDYHKPVAHSFRGVPLRIDVGSSSLRDVARVRLTRPNGTTAETVLVVSASVGVVAEGNALFNDRRVPSSPTGLAIGSAALSAIRAHRPTTVRITANGTWADVSLSSLSILETPWLSGSLRYDLPAAPDDGLLHVAYCEGMGRLRLLATLAALRLGRFQALPGARCFAAPSLSLSSGNPFRLEVDGEAEPVLSASFDFLPGRIRACA